MIAFRGEVWLPNIKCLCNYIKKYYKTLKVFYSIYLVKDLKSNPLYLATEQVNDILSDKNPIPLVNINQVTRLDTNHPFIRLVFNK